jgi:hypothetical protein
MAVPLPTASGSTVTICQLAAAVQALTQVA